MTDLLAPFRNYQVFVDQSSNPFTINWHNPQMPALITNWNHYNHHHIEDNKLVFTRDTSEPGRMEKCVIVYDDTTGEYKFVIKQNRVPYFYDVWDELYDFLVTKSYSHIDY